MSIASICVLVSCLVLTGIASLFSINIGKVVDSVGKTNETSVYIKKDYSQLEAVYIGKEIERLDNVESTTFLPKEEAMEQFKDMINDDALFAEMQDRDPLPDTVVVVMKDLSLYEQTVDQIKRIEGVDDISSHTELAKTLTDISNLVNAISLGITLALTIVSIFIIANTIRVTMYSRRFEISIMKSVGATNSFVRWPFLMEGMVIGFISAILATCGVGLLYEVIMTAIQQMLPIFDSIPIMNVIWYVAAAFAVSGVVIGFFGSLISIRKYLKMEGNEILGW